MDPIDAKPPVDDARLDAAALAASVMEAAPVVLVWLDRAGRILHLNAFGERLTGWRADEVRGRDWFETFVPPREHARLRALHGDADGGAPTGAINAIVTRAGDERVIEWQNQAWRRPDGSDLVVCVGVDVTERARAESALRERDEALARSEAQLADAQRIAQIGSWELDLSTNVARWSAETFRIVEVDPATPAGLFELFSARIHPDDRARGEAVFAAALAAGAPIDEQQRLVMPDGRVKHVRQRARFMPGGDGAPTRVVGTIEDVSTRHAAEVALRDAERNFATLVAASPVGVFRTDAAGRCTFVNERWSEIAGLPAEAALGDGWIPAIHPADRAAVIDAWQRATSEGRTFRMEYRFHRADGVTTWVLDQTLPLRDGAGAITGYIGTLTDITDVRRAQDALRAERALLRAIIDAVPGHVAIYDVAGGFVDASRATLVHIGLTRGELAGVRLWDLPQWRDPRSLREAGRDAFHRAAAGENVRFEVDLERDFRGQPLESELTFVPVHDDAGAITHVATFAVETGDRNRALRRLHEAQRLARVGSWELDLVGGHLRWSPEIYRIFEIEEARFGASYDAFLALVHPDDRAAVDQAYRRSLATRTPYEITHRLQFADGRIKWVQEQCETRYDVDGRPLRSYGTVQDITERVDAEQRVRRILDGMFPFVGLLDRDGTLVEANEAPFAAAGLAREAAIGRAFVDTYWLADAPETQARVRDAIVRAAAGETVRLDLDVRLGPDRRAVFDAMFSPLRDEHGRVAQVIASGVDITDRRRAEEASRRSAEILRALVAGAPMVLFALDRDGVFTLADGHALALLGRAPGELVGRSWRTLVTDPRGVADGERALARALAGEETRLVLRAGEHELETVYAPRYAPDGAADGAIGVAFDVTARNRAQAELARIQAILLAAEAQAELGSWSLDVATNRLRWSPGLFRLYDLEPDPDGVVDYDRVLERVAPEERAQMYARRQHLLAGGRLEPYEFQLRTRAGLRTLRAVTEHADGPDGKIARGFVQDVTAARRAAAELAHSEQRYRRLVEQAADGIFVADPDGRYVDANPRACAMLGYSRDELLQRSIRDVMLPDEAPRLGDLGHQRTMVTRRSLRRKDGSILAAEITANALSDGTLLGVVRDVTERARAEEVLRASEERFRSVVESFPSGVLLVDGAGAITLTNRRLLEQFGYDPEELIGQPVDRLVPADGRAAHASARAAYLTAPTTRPMGAGRDLQGVRRDGTRFPIEVGLQPIEMHGGRMTLATVIDISERQRVAAALRASEAATRLMVEAVQDCAIFRLDVEGRIASWNRGAERIFGHAATEIIGAQGDVFYPPEVRGQGESLAILRAATARGHAASEGWRLRRDGSRFFATEDVTPILGEHGEPLGFTRVTRDVTERRRVHEELRTHSRVLLSMSEGVSFLGADGTIRFANPALHRMFGYADGELIGRPVTVLNDATAAENQTIVAELMGAITARGAWQGEFRNRRKDGGVFYTRAHITRLDSAGEPMFVSVQEDVTAARAAAAAQRRSLAEKETLLREIHHRVKNNLQIISSLLHFQAKKVRRPEDAEAFVEGRNRLLAMILVHEKLYRSDELSRVDVGEYLRDLIGGLVQTFADRARVAVEVVADELRLPVEIALPCGMIVCELVTNAHKYAFPDGRRGAVRIALRRAGERLAITVDDDGVGLPDGFAIERAGSFGWSLVRNLARQLDGEAALAGGPGTRVRVELPLPPEPSGAGGGPGAVAGEGAPP